MNEFVEERLDVGIDYGAVGGPEWSTDVVVFGSGFEQRNARWSEARGRWELGDRLIPRSELDTLQAFFRARRGQAVGFRYRDWNDWQATAAALAPDGTPTVQLTKTYSNAGESQVRTVAKPVGGTLSFVHEGGAYSVAGVDTATGIVTLSALSSAAISGITQASPAVVTATGHGFTTGDTIWIDGVGGMTEINDAAYVIDVQTADTFALVGTDSTGFGAYTSGGTAHRYPQPGDSLTWSGEFDVPVRFGTDTFRARFDAYDPDTGDAAYYLASLPVVEIRP